MARSSVLLPDPDGPMSAVIERGRTAKSTLCSAGAAPNHEENRSRMTAPGRLESSVLIRTAR